MSAPPPESELPLAHGTPTTGSSAPRFAVGWNSFWGRNRPSSIPKAEIKRNEIASLDSRLAVSNAAVARLVLDQTKDISDKKRAVHRTLEAKSTSVVGFATAVLGFTAQYRSGALLVITWHGFPLVIPVFVLELAAIASGLYALQPQGAALPDPVLYNYHTAVEDPDNEARIAMALAQSWAEYERELDAGIIRRSVRFDVAMWTFVLGVAYAITLVFTNVSSSSGGANPNASPSPTAILHTKSVQRVHKP